MKKILKDYLDYLFNSPMLTLLVIVVSMFCVMITSDNFAHRAENEPDVVVVNAPASLRKVTTAVAATTTSTTTKRSTSSAMATSTTTTTAVEEKPAETETSAEQPAQAPQEQPQNSDNSGNNSPPAPNYNYNYSYISAGESPNADFYQSRLVIVGDSIASGFCAYGYIHPAHNIAKESLAVWNMNRYTFDIGGGQMSLVDAAAYANSPLYFVSIGMNDIFGMGADDLAQRLLGIADQILERVPDATVVIGAITPVSSPNYYTNNDTLRSFNTAFENAVNDRNSSRILFFNTHAVLSDPNTGALAGGFGGGDGLHLNKSAYSHALSCLFAFLDETNTKEQMEEHDKKFTE